jgi:hypothetical protein
VDARRTSKREADQLRASARRLLACATAAAGCMLLLVSLVLLNIQFEKHL